MADSASKLGDIISSKITGSVGAFASGLKGSFVSANPAVFAPMTSIMGKGFSSLNKDSAKQAKDQKEESQRRRGFEEERASEAKKAADDMFNVTKNMASNIESIDKTSKDILDALKKCCASGKKDSSLGIPWADIAKAIVAKGIFDKIADAARESNRPSSSNRPALERPSGRSPALERPSGRNPALERPSGRSPALEGPRGRVPALEGPALEGPRGRVPALEGPALEGPRGRVPALEGPRLRVPELELPKSITLFSEGLKGITTTSEGLSRVVAALEGPKGLVASSEGLARIVASLERTPMIETPKILSIEGPRVNIPEAEIGAGASRARAAAQVIEDATYSNMSDKIKNFGETIKRVFFDSFAKLEELFTTFTAMLKETKVGQYLTNIFETFKAEGFASSIGTILEDIKVSLMSVFSKIGTQISGVFTALSESKVGQMITTIFEATGLAKVSGLIFAGLRKLLGPIGIAIFAVIDGLFAVFDTKSIGEALNKSAEDVNWKDRFFAALGGAAGGLIGGTIDFIVAVGDWLVKQILGEEFVDTQRTKWKDKFTGTFTSIFSNLGDVQVGLLKLIWAGITFDSSLIKSTSVQLETAFNNIAIDLKDTFIGWAKQPFAKLYNAVATFVDGIVNGAIDNLVGMLTGDWVDKIPGIDKVRKGLLGLKSNSQLDATPYVYGVGKDQNPNETARFNRKPSGASADTTNITQGTSQRTGANLNDASAGGGRGGKGSAGGATGAGYTSQDLKNIGLNLKLDADLVQKSGAIIQQETITGAKTVQSNFPGITFTGFNDAYHIDKQKEKAPLSSHIKGLAFDFTIPKHLAINDDYRTKLAFDVAKATGGYVIDEYARPSENSNGGHFHVDFTKASRAGGVDKGTGSYHGANTGAGGAGKPGEGFAPPMIPSFDISSPNVPAFSGGGGGGSFETGSMDTYGTGNALIGGSLFTGSMDAGGSGNALSNVVAASVSDIPNSVKKTTEAVKNLSRITITTSQVPVPLTDTEKAYFEREKKIYAEEQEYRTRKKTEETAFFGNLTSIFSDLVKTVQGNVISTKNAGVALSESLLPEFKSLGVSVFGKQYGEAMATTFQRLSGVYMDQFINQSLAPALGMNADILNRSINTYVAGAKLAPQIKEAENQLNAAQKTLDASMSKGTVTQADIVRAAGKGGFTSAQASTIAEQTRLRAEVENKKKIADQLKEQRSEYERSAMEDLMYGMTGVPSGPKTFIDAYGGADSLIKDLTTLTGSPFKPLFNMGNKDMQDPQLALEARMKETQTQYIARLEAANGKLIDQKVTTDAATVENWRKTGEEWNDNLKATLQNTTLKVESVYPSGASLSTAPVLEKFVDTFTDQFTDLIEYTDQFTGMTGGGTAIPGVESTRKNAGGLVSGILASDKSFGGTIASPTDAILGKLKGTATSMAGSFILDKLTGGRSSKSGIVGGAAGNLLSTLLSGGNLTQSLGKSFGMKLGSNASIMDLLSGSSSMSGMGSMFSNLAMSSYAPDFMRQGLMDFGGGINAAGGGWEGISGAMGSGNTSTMLGAGAGMIGNAFSGYGYGQMANSMIAGDKSLGAGFDTVGKIASVAASAIFGPIGGAIVGGIQGLFNAAFGQGPKKVQASGIQGNIGVGGSNLSQFADWSKEGGWFSSGSSGTDISAASSETVKAFDDTIKGIVGSFDTLKEGIGLTGKSISNFSQSIKLNLKDLSEADQMAAIQKAFTTFGTGLINFALPDMLHFRKGSEDLLQTMQRLAEATAIATPTIRALGFIDPKTFFALENVTGLSADFMKTYTADLMDKLITGFGGKEQFQSTMAEFESMAFTPEERQQNQLNAAKADLAVAKEKLKSTGLVINETANVADKKIRMSEGKRLFNEARQKKARFEITDEEFGDTTKAINLYMKTGEMQETMNKSSGTANAPKRIDVLGDTAYMNSLTPGGGAAFAGADLSNVKSAEVILSESIAALSVTTSTSLASVGAKTITASALINSGLVTAAQLTAAGITKSGTDTIFASELVKTGLVNSTQLINAGLISAADVTITASALINSGLVTAAQLTAAGITKSGTDTIFASELVKTGLVNSTQLMNAGLISAADVTNEGLYTLSDFTTTAANTIAVATTTAVSTAAEAMVTAANALTVGIQGLAAGVSDLSTTIGEGPGGGNDVGPAPGVGPSGDGAYFEGPNVAPSLGGAISGAVSGIADAIGGFFGGIADAIGGMFGGGDGGGGTGSGDGNSGGEAGGGFGPQARGGVQNPNRPYIVGEVGPEIVIPNRMGTVVPTHKILEAMNQSNALDSLTRNTLNSVVNNSNPKDLTLHHVMSGNDDAGATNSFLREQHNNRGLNAMKESSATLNSAIIDNSITTVSSPSTNISTSGNSGDVRGTHPIAGAFARTMTSARGFGV